jgi:hypothetical protein
MKALRIALVGFLLLLLLFTGAGLLQRSDWSAERSRVVAAAPEDVHRWLDGVERWPAMLAGENAPAATYAAGEKTAGVGATLAATTEQGGWKLVLERSDASAVEYRIEFPKGMHPVRGSLRLAPEDGRTRVTVKEGGEVGWGPIERFLRGVIEEGHGEELERRLARLERELVERPAPAPAR